jgi:hypothetical protein
MHLNILGELEFRVKKRRTRNWGPIEINVRGTLYSGEIFVETVPGWKQEELLLTIAHELGHYQQWLEGALPLGLGPEETMEREADAWKRSLPVAEAHAMVDQLTDQAEISIQAYRDYFAGWYAVDLTGHGILSPVKQSPALRGLEG